MAISEDQITHLLKAEMAAISDADLRERVAALLVKPTLLECAWDLGAPRETYPCWNVAQDTVSGVGIVYCEAGFGPRNPWGLIWFGDPVPSMGQDSGWFRTFREAAADVIDVTPAALNVC
jgi:hypothetical protein